MSMSISSGEQVVDDTGERRYSKEKSLVRREGRDPVSGRGFALVRGHTFVPPKEGGRQSMWFPIHPGRS